MDFLKRLKLSSNSFTTVELPKGCLKAGLQIRTEGSKVVTVLAESQVIYSMSSPECAGKSSESALSEQF